MDGKDISVTIRRAIGGDPEAIAWLLHRAESGEDALAITMRAILDGDGSRLDGAEQVARTSRDRQVVAIARAHLDGNDDLVDALARDHLVTFPDSLIVSWIASR